MRRCFFVAMLLLTSVFSQINKSEMSVMRIIGIGEYQPSELIDRDVRDANGEVAAGLIIETDLVGLSYDANLGMVKMNHSPGRDFLFIQPKEREIMIMLNGYAPLQVILKKYGIQLQSGQTWKLKLTGDKKLDFIPVNFITSPEGVNVFVDGVGKGIGNTIQIVEGEHELRLEKIGYKPITSKIVVTSLKNLFKYTLTAIENILVKIKSNPTGAIIQIKGVEKGITNKDLWLLPGIHQIKIIKYGFLDEQVDIDVKEDVDNSFLFELKKNTVTLTINVDPKNAKVLINKEDFSNQKVIELVPDKYIIEISKEGYKSILENIDIGLGNTIRKNYTLEAKKGNLQVSVQPTESSVILSREGNIIKSWEGSLMNRGLLEGVYNLSVEHSGYEKVTKSIMIKDGEISTEDIILKLATNESIMKKKIPPIESNMIYVQGGLTQIGSEDGFENEKPVHTIYLDDYYICKYEVTQNEWEEIMEDNPSCFKGVNKPVENVSWKDIQEFLKKLKSKTGGNYRLPTEAEWEYAARGGVKSKHFKYSGSNSIMEVGWYTSNSKNQTHEVGEKKPNELGIYDMSGNVWEWCSDLYDESYYKNSVKTDPKGALLGKYNVLRGGSWNYKDSYCGPTIRYCADAECSSSLFGFRLVWDGN